MGNVCSHTYELGLKARVKVNSVVGLGKVERNLFDFGKILLKKNKQGFPSLCQGQRKISLPLL